MHLDNFLLRNCCNINFIVTIVFKVPLDTSVSASSALSAVEFSRSISRKNRDQPSADNSLCCGEGDGSCQSTANRFELFYCSVLIIKNLGI